MTPVPSHPTVVLFVIIAKYGVGRMMKGLENGRAGGI